MSLEMIAMGRIGVDLYPLDHGVDLADVRSFTKALGGSPTNVAVAAARLGRRAAIITRVGDDPFGRFCRQAAADFGVDTRWLGTDPSYRTPLAFCEIHPPDHFPLLFYREPVAPDLRIAQADLDREAIAAAPLLWTTGTGLSVEPSRAATLHAMRVRRASQITIHDLDHRPMLWEDPAAHSEQSRVALGLASVVVGNTAEAAVAVGDGSPLEQAKALLQLGPRLAIVKKGPDGTLAATRDEIIEVPPAPTNVVNGLGAGDAFGGALCHALLADWPLERTIRFANAAGAIVAGRLLCASAMPTETEIEETMAGLPDD